jgi:Cu/Ag efflux protein CusF
MHTRAVVPAATVLLAMVTVWACSPRPGEEATAPAEERYQMSGEVIRLDAEARTATIKHEEIEGWMDAMTMDFPIRENEFGKLSPGDVIEATVFVQGYDFEVGDVKVVRKGEGPPQ